MNVSDRIHKFQIRKNSVLFNENIELIALTMEEWRFQSSWLLSREIFFPNKFTTTNSITFPLSSTSYNRFPPNRKATYCHVTTNSLFSTSIGLIQYPDNLNKQQFFTNGVDKKMERLITLWDWKSPQLKVPFSFQAGTYNGNRRNNFWARNYKITSWPCHRQYYYLNFIANKWHPMLSQFFQI